VRLVAKGRISWHPAAQFQPYPQTRTKASAAAVNWVTPLRSLTLRNKDKRSLRSPIEKKITGKGDRLKLGFERWQRCVRRPRG
jgi:hypothetical protein